MVGGVEEVDWCKDCLGGDAWIGGERVMCVGW